MPRTTHNVSQPGFIADHKSMDLLGTGGQIGWDAVVAGADGKKTLPAGTVLSRRAADGKLIPRSGVDIVAEPTQTSVGLLATNAAEDAQHHAKSGYGVYVGGVVYETLLPDAGEADFGAMRDELDAAGTGFMFQVYSDSRAS